MGIICYLLFALQPTGGRNVLLLMRIIVRTACTLLHPPLRPEGWALNKALKNSDRTDCTKDYSQLYNTCSPQYPLRAAVPSSPALVEPHGSSPPGVWTRVDLELQTEVMYNPAELSLSAVAFAFAQS